MMELIMSDKLFKESAITEMEDERIPIIHLKKARKRLQIIPNMLETMP